ncbi:MAG TPA: hypothetical protein VHD62_08645 [Opitutaceae bacterium]|nr:hypothetical protein [Opitutaceae bacterium]
MVSSVAELGERPEALRQTRVSNGNRPTPTAKVRIFSPAKLFADHAFAARAWCLIACAAVALSIVEPYFIIKAANSRERVVVLDGAGTFSISPVLGFEQAKELHEAMTLWATLALFQRNPQGFDYPDVLQKLFLTDAYQKAQHDRDVTKSEFELKNIHQKPEVFKMDVLRTREDRVLVKVEGQLVRTGVFENQVFTEAPKFTLNLTFARNPNMLANKRYPLAVWTYDYTIH